MDRRVSAMKEKQSEENKTSNGRRKSRKNRNEKVVRSGCHH